MHPLHTHLAAQVSRALRRGVAMIVDPSGAFRPFIDELAGSAGWSDEHPETFEITIAGKPARLAVFDGSWFGLRAAVEPWASADTRPEPPVLLYLPTSPPPPQQDVLMELVPTELRLTWRLDSEARACLRSRFSDAVIDTALEGGSASYDDIVQFLGQRPDRVSKLRPIFGPTHDPILDWLTDAQHDSAIQQKGATAELYQRIGAKLGLELPSELDLSSARQKLARYLLVGEFRQDLQGPPPASVAMIPPPPSPDHAQQVLDLVAQFRDKHPDAYATRADQVQEELHLDAAGLDPAILGRIDTFRFEERRLLEHCAVLLARAAYAEALVVITERGSSFWVEREVGRKAQWELCRRVAALGLAVQAVPGELPPASAGPAAWVERYAAPEGWHRVDGAQRALETWRGQMADAPACEQAIALVLRDHEKLLHKLAQRFSSALAANGWTVAGALHQTRIHPTVVEPRPGVVAYLLIDALRYEMGAELARLLDGVEDLQLRPAIAALPSITPVGMAALLPGAATDFDVVAHGSDLAARVDGSIVATARDRWDHLRARVPKVFVTRLDAVLHAQESKLRAEVSAQSLVLVHATDIDELGEKGNDWAARRAMAEVLGDITRAVRKLARAGVEHFVITSDHGHLFGLRKSDDMKTDAPGGETVTLHRRCWAGHGGTTPPGTQRVSAAQLGYASGLEFVFPTGLGVLKAGGDLSFHHGSTSLQEMVIPVLSFRVLVAQEAAAPSASPVTLSAVPAKITNRMFVVTVQTQNLLGSEEIGVRVVLLSSKQAQVGHAGMASVSSFDPGTGMLRLQPGQRAQVGLALTHDDLDSLRVAVLDPDTAAVLAQSDLLPVDLQR